jgi:hypothetical protein
MSSSFYVIGGFLPVSENASSIIVTFLDPLSLGCLIGVSRTARDTVKNFIAALDDQVFEDPLARCFGVVAPAGKQWNGLASSIPKLERIEYEMHPLLEIPQAAYSSLNVDDVTNYAAYWQWYEDSITDHRVLSNLVVLREHLRRTLPCSTAKMQVLQQADTMINGVLFDSSRDNANGDLVDLKPAEYFAQHLEDQETGSDDSSDAHVAPEERRSDKNESSLSEQQTRLPLKVFSSRLQYRIKQYTPY